MSDKKMRLFNTIIVFDCYTVAYDHEAAREAAMANARMSIEDGGLRATEENALEVREPREIRETWREQKPCVGTDVSDEDFEMLKGKNTQQIFDMLHTKKEGKK